MSRTKRLLDDNSMPQPRLAGLLGISQAHVSRLANGAKESEQTRRLLDILERDIAAGIDVTASGYRIGFGGGTEKAGEDFRCDALSPAAAADAGSGFLQPGCGGAPVGGPWPPAPLLRITLTDEAEPLFARLSALAERFPEFGEGLLGLVEAGEEIFEIDLDPRAASGADKMTLRLKPGNAVLALFAATGAGDLNDLLATETGHDAPPAEVASINTPAAAAQAHTAGDAP